MIFTINIINWIPYVQYNWCMKVMLCPASPQMDWIDWYSILKHSTRNQWPCRSAPSRAILPQIRMKTTSKCALHRDFFHMMWLQIGVVIVFIKDTLSIYFPDHNWSPPRHYLMRCEAMGINNGAYLCAISTRTVLLMLCGVITCHTDAVCYDVVMQCGPI